ncbi:hypothetical protein NPS01_20080 [Nocardioides psychrotolerans]|uniref:hypothetical protein n=1 Tax=Nocardioides psychrotolerans TaxID=1005945 RepID=UPI000AF44682|nr:hypothetical protein [Nocardioides psychrotolerans]GEP38345.1 hypothetical protein NPS01_20080 [Nocardioides psychrotolerans]
MAARPTDRIVIVATGALALGRSLGIKAARAAQPLLARAVGAVRTRVEPPASPVAPVAPDPAASTAPPAAAPATAPASAPTPRTVAKNIAPHPPAPPSGASKKKPTPGAKLPVRKPPLASRPGA